MEITSQRKRLASFIVSLFACAFPSICSAVALVSPNSAPFDPAIEKTSKLESIADIYRAQARKQIANSGRKFARDIQNKISNQIDQLMEKYFMALSIERELETFLNSAIRHEGLEDSVDFISGETKSWQAIIEKAFLRDEYKGTNITDIARKKIVFKDGSLEQILQLAGFLEQYPGLEIVEAIENNFLEPKPSGYRDVKLKFKFQGAIVELIFTLSSIDRVASEERREVYEKERSGEFVHQNIKTRFLNLYRIATLVALGKPIFGLVGLR